MLNGFDSDTSPLSNKVSARKNCGKDVKFHILHATMDAELDLFSKYHKVFSVILLFETNLSFKRKF